MIHFHVFGETGCEGETVFCPGVDVEDPDLIDFGLEFAVKDGVVDVGCVILGRRTETWCEAWVGGRLPTDHTLAIQFSMVTRVTFSIVVLAPHFHALVPFCVARGMLFLLLGWAGGRKESLCTAAETEDASLLDEFLTESVPEIDVAVEDIGTIDEEIVEIVVDEATPGTVETAHGEQHFHALLIADEIEYSGLKLRGEQGEAV